MTNKRLKSMTWVLRLTEAGLDELLHVLPVQFLDTTGVAVLSLHRFLDDVLKSLVVKVVAR